MLSFWYRYMYVLVQIYATGKLCMVLSYATDIRHQFLSSLNARNYLIFKFLGYMRYVIEKKTFIGDFFSENVCFGTELSL